MTAYGSYFTTTSLKLKWFFMQRFQSEKDCPLSTRSLWHPPRKLSPCRSAPSTCPCQKCPEWKTLLYIQERKHLTEHYDSTDSLKENVNEQEEIDRRIHDSNRSVTPLK